MARAISVLVPTPSVDVARSGLLKEDEFDIAGAATGAVDADKQLGKEKVKAGDVLIAMPSSGFHANGYSLIRHIVKEKNLDLGKKYGDLDKSLGEVLLTPTEIYALDCLALIKLLGENLRTFSHVTGGGLADNTTRVVPDSLSANFDRSTWSLPRELTFMATEGAVPQNDYERTWNCGVGMVAIVDPTSADLAIKALAARGMQAWAAGTVSATTPGSARSALEGDYRKR